MTYRNDDHEVWPRDTRAAESRNNERRADLREEAHEWLADLQSSIAKALRQEPDIERVTYRSNDVLHVTNDRGDVYQVQLHVFNINFDEDRP